MAEENQGANPPLHEPNEPLPRNYNQIEGRNNESRKTSWPELVGISAEEAEKKIKEEMEGVEIQVIPPNHFVTYDFRLQRVRLYVDDSNKVVRQPIIG